MNSGKYLDKLGVDSKLLERLYCGEIEGTNVGLNDLTVGVVLDVYDWVRDKKYCKVSVLDCLLSLCGRKDLMQNVSGVNLVKDLNKCVHERKLLRKSCRHDGGKRLNEFMERMYVLPGLRDCVSLRDSSSGMNDSVRCVDESMDVETGPSATDCVVLGSERVQMFLKGASGQSCDECQKLFVEKCEMESRINALERDLAECKERLAGVGERNVRRKIARRDTKIENLTREVNDKLKMLDERAEQLREQEKMNREKDNECTTAYVEVNRVNQKNESLKVKNARLRKRLWYQRRVKDSVVNVRNRMTEMNERVKELECENVCLKDRLEEFMSSDTVKCFVGGKYSMEIRRVYQELLVMGVSANKCEAIVRSVLEGFGVNVDRLPKETCAKRMLLECRALAWMQLSECLSDERDVTVMSDGTSKYGHHYETFDVSMKDGRVYTLGLRDVSSGSADCMLQVLCEILNDIEGMHEGDVSQRVKGIVAKMRNTMGDRASVEKKFNSVLSSFRKEILPDVVNDWSDMNESERKKCERMNHFFCGMHLLVSMAEQTDATLRVWENMVFGENAVGANAVCGSKMGRVECGSVRLIRTVCKAVQDRGCERSGKPVDFRQYLKVVHDIQKVPLAPFKGNRFNIVFHNGAGVYFLHEQLKEFLDGVKDDNMLMKAVHADINVNQYVASARALGLINKLVTTPLWSVLEQKGHVHGLKERFERMYECFKMWAMNAEDVLYGRVSLFEDVSVRKDEVYECLVKECELDGMTKQILEMLFASFACKLKSLVCDQLSGGVNEMMDDERMSETASVPRTNVDCERDFGMLDRMMRERPRAYTCAMEGMIMYRKNGTSDWLEKMDEVVLQNVIEKARLSVDEQKRMFVRRKAVIGAERSAKLERKKFERERKELKERVRAEDLVQM